METITPGPFAVLQECRIVSIHPNHMDMTKFENKRVNGHERVCGILRVWIEKMREQVRQDDQCKTSQTT